MKTMLCAIVVSGALLLLDDVSFAAAAKCPPDMVQVGPICVDKYEASVWQISPANTSVIKKLKTGTETETGLTAGGATQRGVGSDDYPCNDNGNDCSQIFAVSIAGVTPSSRITWFQAQQACLNSGKRLLTNAEWQAAAAGTPDPGTDNGTTDCNTAGTVVDTGSRSNCVSRFGVFDMVGNFNEWVADWIAPSSGGCGSALYLSDFNCLSEVTPGAGAAAIIRGGDFTDGTEAGVFAVSHFSPSLTNPGIGFRCGR